MVRACRDLPVPSRLYSGLTRTPSLDSARREGSQVRAAHDLPQLGDLYFFLMLRMQTWNALELTLGLGPVWDRVRVPVDQDRLTGISAES